MSTYTTHPHEWHRESCTMDTDARGMSPYWDRLGSHDLTLMLDRQGALWKFRRKGSRQGPALDAHLDAGALVVSLSVGHDRTIGVLVGDHRVRFTDLRSESETVRADVLLPFGFDLDEDGSSAVRRDGIVEVRVPPARRRTPAVEAEVAVRSSAA